MEIDGRTARDISTRGRCFVEIPGVVEGAEMQTPYVTPEMIGDKFRGHGPRFPLSNLDGIVVPEMASIAISNEQRELAIKLHREGKPQYKIEEAIFGYHGGLAYWTVSDILKTVIKSKIVNSTNSTSTTVDNKTGAKRSSSRKRAV